MTRTAPVSLPHPRRAALAFAAMLCLLSQGCVASTYDGVSATPEIPLPPDAQKEAAEAPQSGPIEVGARHILISYKGAMRAAPYTDRSKDEAQKLAEDLVKQARGGADFAELAKEYSDDPGSAATGGSLGKFRREQMVAAFSDTAFALEIGEISDVVESPFGFHIIVRDE